MRARFPPRQLRLGRRGLGRAVGAVRARAGSSRGPAGSRGGAASLPGCPLFTSPRGAGQAASPGSPSPGPGAPGRLSPRRSASLPRPFVACAPAPPQPSPRVARPPPLPIFPRCNLSSLLMDVRLLFFSPLKGGNLASPEGALFTVACGDPFPFPSRTPLLFLCFSPGRQPHC